MAEWSEHAHYGNANGPMGLPPAVTSLSFDPVSDLLWQGTSFGTVSSLYSSQLSRYTSFAGHGVPTRPSPAKGILADERHIYTIGDNSIKCSTRRGLAKWNTTTAADIGTTSMNLVSMCATPLAASSDILAGGVSVSAANTGELDAENDLLISINNSTGSVVRQVPAEAPLLQVRKSARFVCAATMNGHIQLRDPRTLRVENKLHAHPGGLIDVQADGNIIYSAGWTVRQGHPVPEPLIKVHDLRTMRALVPIPFAAPGGPALLAIHPKLSSTVVVSAPQGQFQIVDIGNPGDARFFYTGVSSYVTSLAISPSADFIAFGEADGTVRLWSSSSDTSNLRFNAFNSSQIDFPDVTDPTPYVNWTTETPLSSIGMPHYSEKLLSYVEPEHTMSEASPLFNPPSKVDTAVLAGLKTVDYIGYASLPPHLRGKRNVISGKGPGGLRASAQHTADERKKNGIPRFRSEKEKDLNKKAAAAAAAGDKKKKKSLQKKLEASVKASEDAPLDGEDQVNRTTETVQPDEAESHNVEDQAEDDTNDEDDDIEDEDEDEEGQEDVETAEAMLAKGNIPSYYRLKTIQYSRFGVEDFDFDFYNRTVFSGLETHIQNSYANSYLQALHYLVPFRDSAKAHILYNCARENCLLCEAGFLFRMLEDAKGANCHATNFLRVFGNSHKAAGLGLMDRDDGKTSSVGTGSSSRGANEIAYSNLVQTLNRFVLECTANEAQLPVSSSGGAGSAGQKGPDASSHASNGGGSASIGKLFSLNASTKTICTHCGRDSSRSSPTLSVDLIYPRRSMSNEPAPGSDFASVLRASLLRETQNRAPCRACQFTAMFRSRRVLPPTQELPRILSVNAAIHAPEHLQFWLDANQGKDSRSHHPQGSKTYPGGPVGRRNAPPPQTSSPAAAATTIKRNYLPPRIAIDARGDDVRVVPIYTATDLEQAKQALGGNPAIYKLRSMVVQISADKESPHLCALARVPEVDAGTETPTQTTSKKGAKSKNPSLGPWYLFNDFLVRNVSEKEALGFQNTWKMPSVLMWEREDCAPLSMLELAGGRTGIDPTILCQDFNITWDRNPNRIRHETLSQDELPEPGTLVSIDAEFVALNQEELEIRSDGTRSVIRPTRLSLARVSVIRGQGEKEGKAFIDDHIYTQEEVVDYLTKFSGILPGDLDPKTSKHTVVPHKAAYKKLRLLVDRGCIFIGHGLKKDFRIINIYVPAHQVIDTVDLYHSPNHPRRLSLRFLSWFLLKMDIQSGVMANNQVTARERQATQDQNVNQDGLTTTLKHEISQSSAGAGSTAVEGGHDSIEDALAALRLFRLYQSFQNDNRLADVLDDVYEVGRRSHWKPPNSTT